jgi:hypothetical protein
MKYVGGAFLPGVPTRDLTEAEVVEYGRKRLLASGLYVESKPERPAEVEIQEVT